jgi:hypothetical protein
VTTIESIAKPGSEVATGVAAGVAAGDSAADDRVGDEAEVRSGEAEGEVDGDAGVEPHAVARTTAARRLASVRSVLALDVPRPLGADCRTFAWFVCPASVERILRSSGDGIRQ